MVELKKVNKRNKMLCDWRGFSGRSEGGRGEVDMKVGFMVLKWLRSSKEKQGWIKGGRSLAHCIVPTSCRDE